MSGRVNPPPDFPPDVPTTLQTVIPAYPYAQYTDDDTVQQFFAAQNYLAQQWVNDFNALNLPYYPSLSDGLLDWVAGGLYGLTRPILGIPRGHPSGAGPYNTVQYNAIPYGAAQLTLGQAPVYQYVSDDEFQRIITWHTWKGDGFQYTTQWLKKRVHRFLNGANGVLAVNDNTFDVSISMSGFNTTIIVTTNAIATTLTLAIDDGVLALPFQYSYTVITFPSSMIFPNTTVSASAQMIMSLYPASAPVAQVIAGVAQVNTVGVQSAPVATVSVDAEVM